MKSVLIMIDSLTVGGAEKSLVSLLPFLAERDYRIDLMLMARGGAFEAYVPDNVRIVDFPYRDRGRMSRLRYSLALRMPWNKRRHGAEVFWNCVGRGMPSLEQEYDVAIAYQQGFPTFYIADKVKAKRKFCWINADIAKAGYSPEFCQKFYRRYDKISAVSEILRDTIVYPAYCDDKEKIFTCLDILNESLIRTMASEVAIPTKRKKWYLTTVGRLVPPKGYDLAIDAASILKARGVDFEWHFVGGGGLRDRLLQMANSRGVNDCIVFEGEQNNPYPYIKAADIYVQTSKFEGFGLTIGEAKILGRPIVSTNFPVVYNQLTDGVNGLVVEMTGESIANGIMRLMHNAELRQKLTDSVACEHNTTAQTESAKVISLIEE